MEEAFERAENFEITQKVAKELIEIYKKIALKLQIEEKDFNENVEKALKYYERCFQIYERIGEKKAQGQISYKIGNVYYKFKRYDKSIEHQLKYLELLEHQNDVKIIYHL